MNGEGNITERLRRSSLRDNDALKALYGELRHLAHDRRWRERPGSMVETTALVHEAYLRLIDQTRVKWRSRTHFLAVAAETMRRVLVDDARARLRAKRGGGAEHLPIEEVCLADAPPNTDILALHEALESLAVDYPREAQVVELRFFGGLTEEEVAETIGLARKTVGRDWKFAKAWLLSKLVVEAPDAPPPAP